MILCYKTVNRINMSKYGDEDWWFIRESYIPIMINAFKTGTRISFSDREWTEMSADTDLTFICRQYIGDDDIVNVIVTNDERRRLMKVFVNMAQTIN